MSSCSLRFTQLVVAPLFAIFSTHAFATTTCVSTAAGLQAALTAAQTDNEDNDIQLVATTYTLATPLSVEVSDGHALTIEGGYPANCASLPTAVPDNTLITGANVSGTSVRITTSGGGLIVRNLTFTALKPAAGTDAILIGDYSAASDSIRVENIAVTTNTVSGVNDSVLALFPSGGLIFDDNIVHDNANALAAVKVSANYTGLPVAVANNTIAGNLGPGLRLDVYTETPVGLYNNILWNNVGDDLFVTGNINTNIPPLALNNTWLNCSGCTGLAQSSANNSTADPKLTTTAPKYRLGANSPAINAGLPLPTVLPLTDAAEGFRVVGSAPDQGAYESSTNDFSANTYLVISTNDSGAGTLRQAILDANGSGAPALVNIHLLNGCPSTIELASLLPAITVPMLIDGYYDPNSSVNTFGQSPAGEIATNATICTILLGTTSPQLQSAFSVPSSAASTVHVEVRGVRFANFATAIDLSAGNGHWIHGNTFAGPFIFGPIGNGIGVQIDGGFANVIGGPLAADVNLLSFSSGAAGIVITGGVGASSYNTITNNSIGGDPTGAATNYGNQNTAVELHSTNQNIVTNNWIVANGGDGIVIDNAAFNLVQGNAIGSGIGQGLGNKGAGVHLLDGASQNWIGTTDPRVVGGGNVVIENLGPGVWIGSDAGVYNEVSSNLIAGNGGLAIDLDAAGPTPNSGSESAGPNLLLHKPVLTGAVYASAGQITVSGSIPTESAGSTRYVTFYANSACGDASSRIGTYILQPAANGTISFNLSMPSPDFGPAYITAIDDSYTAGVTDTSEISNSKKLSVGDDLFNDSFDCY